MKRITEKRTYELLGVKIFRKYILFSYEKICKKLGFEKHIGYRLEKNSITEIKNYKNRAKSFAYAHIIALIITLTYSIILSLGVVYNILFTALNLYCIMVQRYNCLRINEILDHHQKLENKRKEFQQEELENTTNNHQKEILIKKKEELLRISHLHNEDLDNQFIEEEIEYKPKVYSLSSRK